MFISGIQQSDFNYTYTCIYFLRQHFKNQSHHFANKGRYSQSYGFSCSHVLMGVLDHKEGLMQKNSCFGVVALEKTLESLLDYKEIKLVNPKEKQP